MLDAIDIENSPQTYAKGSKPIDSIMISANIGALKATYLPFGEGVGDHHPLVIDIEEEIVFGIGGEPSQKLRARRLKMKDLRIIAEYTNILHKFYLKHTLFKKVFHLNSIPISYPIQQ